MDSGMIFEHFAEYISDTDNDMIDNPQGAVRLLREDSYFNDFMDNITEGLESGTRNVVGNILNKQRESLLTESANVGPSIFTHGWTVMSFRATRSATKEYKLAA